MTRLVLLSLLLGGCGHHDTAQAATGFHLELGDATVYELVDRRWNKRDKPARELVLHGDGQVEMINDKTDKPMATFTVKPDGTLAMGDKDVAKIGEHGIVQMGKAMPLTIDGNTIELDVNDKHVTVTLADDGNVTVAGLPDGNKWRIDGKDKDVRRTAFLVLALDMKAALD